MSSLQFLSRVPGAARNLLASCTTRRRATLLLVSGLLAASFAVVTQSSSQGHERDRLRESLHRGADRLTELQRMEGTWSLGAKPASDLRQAGHGGRALLLAYQITREPRHMLAARRTVLAIGRALREGQGASSPNLQLLAEFGEVTGQPSLVEAARAAWMTRYQSTDAADGREAARQLLELTPSGGMVEGDWRNYLLARAAEEADAARALGFTAWSDAYLLEAAGTWSPKHDHDYWASAAGALLGALGRSQDPSARRLELAHRGLLEANELIHGISWNDTPYDAYVYSTETAAALAGRARQERGADGRSATFAGLEFLAARQAPSGGWGALLSIVEHVAADGDEELPPAAAAEGESALIDAAIVEALALGLGARG